MIFGHIRKKSKSFPTLLTSKAMDSSHQPPVLTRKGTTQANHFEQNEIEVHFDNVILMDSEPTDASPKSTTALSYSTEKTGSCKKISGSASSISGSVFSSKFAGDSNGESENKKLTYEDPPLEGSKIVGCKRAFPIELDPVPKRPDVQQHRSFEQRGDRSQVSFLGFKSVFSFLWLTSGYREDLLQDNEIPHWPSSSSSCVMVKARPQIQLLILHPCKFYGKDCENLLNCKHLKLTGIRIHALKRYIVRSYSFDFSTNTCT